MTLVTKNNYDNISKTSFVKKEITVDINDIDYNLMKAFKMFNFS